MAEWDCGYDAMDDDGDGSPFDADPMTGRTHVCSWPAAGANVVAARVTDSDGDQAIGTLDVDVVDGEESLVPCEGRLGITTRYHTYEAQPGGGWAHVTEATLTNTGTSNVYLPVRVVFDGVVPAESELASGFLGSEGAAYGKWCQDFDDAAKVCLEPGESVSAPLVWSLPDNQTAGKLAFSIMELRAKQTPPYFKTMPATIAFEGEPYVATLQAEDADGDEVYYRFADAAQVPPGMTLAEDTGVLSWTPDQRAANPDAPWSNPYAVTVEAHDGYPGSFAELSLEITVREVNLAPTMTSVPETSVVKGDLYAYTLVAADADDDGLTYSMEGGDVGALAGQEFTWDTASAELGTYWVEFHVADDGDPQQTAIQEFPITVVGCDPFPVIENTVVPEAYEGLPFRLQVHAVVGDDPARALNYFLEEYPDGMAISDEGTITWTPSFQSAGTWRVDVLVSTTPDWLDDCIATKSYMVHVNERNTIPDVQTIPLQVLDEGELLTLVVEVVDEDGDPHLFRLENQPKGMWIDCRQGVISWRPSQTAAEQSPYVFTVRASDPSGAYDEEEISVTVNNVNLPPQIKSIAPAVAWANPDAGPSATPYSYTVIAEDPDGDELADATLVAIPSSPTSAAMTITNSVVSWEPNIDDIGYNPNSFIVEVCESEGIQQCTQSEFDIEVRPLPRMGSEPDIALEEPASKFAHVGDSYTQNVIVTDEDHPVGEDFDCEIAISPELPAGSSSPAWSGSVAATSGGTIIPISWNPVSEASTEIPYTITISVRDKLGGRLQLSYRVWVYPTAEDRPSIVSVAPDFVEAGQCYEYQVIAVDPSITNELIYQVVPGRMNNDPSMPLLVPPNGFAVDPVSGLVSWCTTMDDIGQHWVAVEVCDGVPGEPYVYCGSQTFSIVVSRIMGNHAPVIGSQPSTSARVGQPYSYQVTVTDPDEDDRHEYFLLEAPVGAVIDRMTGLITWDSPRTTQIDSHRFHVRVTDSAMDYGDQRFTVSVTRPQVENHPPGITSMPGLTAASAGAAQYSYAVGVSDVDANDWHTYTLERYPLGMTIDANGVITWDPADDDVGSHSVVVRATDSKYAFDEQSYVLTVSTDGENQAPVITSHAPTSAVASRTYTYTLEAYDYDGDDVTFRFIRKPAWARLEECEGQFKQVVWTPVKGQVGTEQFVIRAEDGQGGWDEQTIAVAVSTDTPDRAPTIVSNPITRIATGEPYCYTVVVEDPDFGDSVYLTVLQGPLEIDSDNPMKLVWQMPSQGTMPIRIRATDSHGAFDEQEFAIVASGSGTNRAPRIVSQAITCAESNGGANYEYQVQAVDPDYDSLYWTVSSETSMSINSTSGLITWDPDVESGTYPVLVTVSDGNGGEAKQAFSVTVSPNGTNQPPMVITNPVRRVVEGRNYLYPVEWVDSDLPITAGLTLMADPSMCLQNGSDAGTEIIWNPVNAIAGIYPIELSVTDGLGATANHPFNLEVIADSGPQIKSLAPPVAIAGKTYRYEVVAIDADDTVIPNAAEDGLVYELSIDPTEGACGWDPEAANVLLWTPSENDIQDSPFGFKIGVRDPSGAEDTQRFSVKVVGLADGDYYAPNVVVSSPSSPVETSTQTVITISATDDVALSSVTCDLTEPGETTPISLLNETIAASEVKEINRTVTYMVPANEGLYRIEVTVADEAGNVTVRRADFRTAGVADTDGDPNVAIMTPDDSTADGDYYRQTVITEPTTLYGWVVDAELQRYWISYRPVGTGDDAWTNLPDSALTDPYSAIGAVDNEAPLGTLDPTRMANGLYEVRLLAVDMAGKGSDFIRVYAIDGNVKIGNLSMSFNDLSLPVSGIPISVVRTYDGRLKIPGDFGRGWKMEFTSLSLQESGVAGIGWMPVGGGFWNTVCDALPTASHSVTLAWPDGRTEVFELWVDVQDQGFGDGQYCGEAEIDDIGFTRISSTTSELEIIGQPPGSWSPEREALCNESVNSTTFTPWSPEGYALTTADHTVYTFMRQQHGCSTALRLTKVSDTNGNTIEFTSDGIRHSSGPCVSWVRDDQGRIRKLFDPDGNSIEYIYDSRGDLVQVVDRQRNIVEFRYNSEHDLIDIIDPRGVSVARNVYDDAGRLIAHIDAAGNRIEYAHCVGEDDPDGECLGDDWEIVFDRHGQPTAYQYDIWGNVIQQRNALAQVTSYGYDDRHNQISTTIDDGGLAITTTQEYDDRDRVKWSEDQYGNRTNYDYDDADRLIETISPLGRRTVNEYDDATGNLEKTFSYPQGGGIPQVTEYTYYADGNQKSIRDAMGYLSTYSYDSSGNLKRQVDAEGTITEYEYDNQGRCILQRQQAPNGVLEVITKYTYDVNGSLIVQTRQDGEDGVEELVARTIYNEIGKQQEVITPIGSTFYEYDVRGNVSRVTYPDSSFEEYEYDAEGRRLSVRNREGNITRTVYDNLGRATKSYAADVDVVYAGPGGSTDPQVDVFTETIYDNAGRVATRFDELRNPTTYDYTPYVDDQGKEFHKQVVTNALSQSTTQLHDEVGNLVMVVDADSNVVRYEYDGFGRQIKTIFGESTDAPFIETEYDANGRKTAEIDQAGKRTEFTYDKIGRLISVIDADGHATTYGYDKAGNRTTQVDAELHETKTEYDGFGRLLQRSLPYDVGQTPTDFEHFVYNHAGNLQQHTAFDGSATLFQYDANGRLSNRYLPYVKFSAFIDEGNLQAQANFTFTPNESAGELSIRFTHNLDVGDVECVHLYSSSTPNLLSICSAGASDPLPTSIEATWSLDPDQVNALMAGEMELYAQLTSGPSTSGGRISASSPIVEYEHSNAGLRTRAGGTAFGYDERGRLIKETKATGEVMEYGYDKAGNRTLVRIRPSEGAPASSETSYTYDVLNRVDTVVDSAEGTTSYTYDGVGNLETVTYPNAPVGVDSWSTKYVYDSQNRLTGILQRFADGGSGSGVVVHEYVYTLGLAGNRTKVEEFRYDEGSSRPALAERTVRYIYDDLYRLVHEIVTVKNSAGTGTQWQRTDTFTYDKVGNRKTMQRKTINQQTDVLYDYNAADQLLCETATTLQREAGGGYAAAPRPTRFAGVALGSIAALAFACLLAPFALLRTSGQGRKAQRNRRFVACVSAFFVPLMAIDPSHVYALHKEAMAYQALAAAGLATVDPNTQVTTYDYDANGNMVEKVVDNPSAGIKTTLYTYDAENRLATVDDGSGVGGVVSYTYDADGIRTSKLVGVTLTTYVVDKNRPYAQVLEERLEVGGVSTVVKRYVYGHDLISQTDSPGDGQYASTSYFHYDGQMSTRALSQGTTVIADPTPAPLGSVIAEYSYDAFGSSLDLEGNPLPAGSTSATDYLYTGEQHDANAGFYYLRARYYSPSAGRFITRDIYGGNQYNPVTLHRYLYCGNSPVNYIDPSGLMQTGSVVELGITLVIHGILLSLVSTPNVANAPPLGDYTVANSSGMMVYDLPIAIGVGFVARFVINPIAGALSRYTRRLVSKLRSAEAVPVSGPQLPITDPSRLLPAPKPVTSTVPPAQITINAANGKEFEQAVLRSLRTRHGGRVIAPSGNAIVPDLPVNNVYGVTDAKNVISLNQTLQLRSMAEHAESCGLPFNLIISPRTETISLPLQTAIKRTGGTVFRYNMNTNVFSEVAFVGNEVLP